MALEKNTHDEASEARRRLWRRMRPDERVRLGVEMSVRARLVERENDRLPAAARGPGRHPGA